MSTASISNLDWTGARERGTLYGNASVSSENGTGLTGLLSPR